MAKKPEFLKSFQNSNYTYRLVRGGERTWTEKKKKSVSLRI